MNKIIPVLILLVAASPVYAEGVDAKQIYFGAGVGFNDTNNRYYNDDAVGFQLFAGLPLDVDIGSAALAVEVGYMDTGDFDNGASANGLWSTAVASLPLNNSLKLLGRFGYDFGDDDGVMVGVGIGVPADNAMDIRFEYVIRDNIDSLQVNLVIRQ